MGVDPQTIRLRVLWAALGAAGGLGLAGPAGAAASTLRVNTSRDEVVAHDGRCSLREAIATADTPDRRTDCGVAGRGPNTIVLTAGRDALSLAPTGTDDNGSGDLNVAGTTPLTIAGAGPRATVIDARGLGDRVLSVASSATLVLKGLRITGGHPPIAAAGSVGLGGAGCASPVGAADAEAGADGGGILNAGTLVLDTAAVVGNTAGTGGTGATGDGGGGCGGGSGGPGGNGGGVYSRGRLTVIDSTIRGNAAGAGGPGGGAGGSGGGIYSAAGSLTVENSTLVDNSAGRGGASGAPSGPGGGGGDGGAVAVLAGAGTLRNDTLAENAVGTGGAGASSAGSAGADGIGGAVFATSSTSAGGIRLQNTIVASSVGPACAGTSRGAISDVGHDLSYGDRTCPGRDANPRLGPLQDNGGATETMALRPGSAAIDRVPRHGAGCPSTDQRGARRPEGRACDIGAYEFALPTITVTSPAGHTWYERGSRVTARFGCQEGGIASAIAVCRGSVAAGRAIGTARTGSARFLVTAVDKSGGRARKTVRYLVFQYVNPLREVSGLTPRRIDLGVDYAGWGPLLALGDGVVTMATDSDSGPSSCWAISCWPGGGIVVYRLTAGPFAGKYVYVAEHITVTVRPGQRITAGQQIATLYSGYPWSEWGWAAGPGPEAMGIADGHACPCGDPGGWSTIEGRDFDHLLVMVGAPSGWLQSTPNQSMPRGWPSWSR